MKRISIFLFLMMISLGYSFAQSGTAQARGERKTMEERTEMRTSRMVEELSLNTDQASKIRQINLNQANKMKAMREKQAAENQDFRQEARSIADETEKQYQIILTPEQFEKYKQNKAQKKEGNKSGKKDQKKTGSNS
jgi:Spy/CpxP family protein refolding chaperone